jgi:hypothetical protein
VAAIGCSQPSSRRDADAIHRLHQSSLSVPEFRFSCLVLSLRCGNASPSRHAAGVVIRSEIVVRPPGTVDTARPKIVQDAERTVQESLLTAPLEKPGSSDPPVVHQRRNSSGSLAMLAAPMPTSRLRIIAARRPAHRHSDAHSDGGRCVPQPSRLQKVVGSRLGVRHGQQFRDHLCDRRGLLCRQRLGDE